MARGCCSPWPSSSHPKIRSAFTQVPRCGQPPARKVSHPSWVGNANEILDRFWLPVKTRALTGVFSVSSSRPRENDLGARALQVRWDSPPPGDPHPWSGSVLLLPTKYQFPESIRVAFAPRLPAAVVQLERREFCSSVFLRLSPQ